MLCLAHCDIRMYDKGGRKSLPLLPSDEVCCWQLYFKECLSSQLFEISDPAHSLPAEDKICSHGGHRLSVLILNFIFSDVDVLQKASSSDLIPRVKAGIDNINSPEHKT